MNPDTAIRDAPLSDAGTPARADAATDRLRWLVRSPRGASTRAAAGPRPEASAFAARDAARPDAGPAAPWPDADEVVDRVEATMHEVLERVPPDEIGDPRDFRRALGVLLGQTRATAQRLQRDPAAPLAPGDVRALEAIVLTDGTRPSLLVRQGRVDATHPLASAWRDDLTTTQDTVAAMAASVGRIEPADATARNYFGTGWVVDSDAGLVLTNHHVVEAMWQRLAHVMIRTAAGFRVLDGAYVDFDAEAGSTGTNRFRIVQAVPVGTDGPGFSRLDAALLTIEPTDPDQKVPPAIRPLGDPDGPRGNLASFCVIGFPGPPPYRAGLQEGVDWGWVNATLFGNRYGVKRLAPGNAHRPLGSLGDDPRSWVFGHDATTLGGSSGSAVVGWLEAAPGAFGLHFAGTSVESNYAHALVACAEELAAAGVQL